MKRTLYILLSFLPLGLGAQNMYETASFMQNDLTGTSRYISMGGAMGALGGDISVMGSNPAGIALYRSNDFAFTGSMAFNRTKAAYNGTVVDTDNVNFDVESFGAVLANKVYDGGALKFFNVGLGYRRKNGLANEFTMRGSSIADDTQFSQQYAIRELYDNNPFELEGLDYRAFEGFSYSWLPLLATYANIGDTDGNLLTGPDGSLIFAPTGMEFINEERGGVSEVDLNVSANINDWLYVGATFSLAAVDYTANTVYYEYDEVGDIYSIGNYNHIEGNGFNIKLGAILRPFKYSPFKLGVAVHTPTWYDLNNFTYADINGPFNDFYDTRDEELFYDVLQVRSKFNTPWRYIASASYTFGTFMALNVDYEYTDYSSAKYGRVDAGSKYAQNEEIKYNLKEQHSLRVGAEFNLGGGISLRGGYCYSSAPFRSDAYKEMMNMPVTATSTDYNNRFSKEAVTFGAGYRGKVFYFDMAYVYDTQEADFYPYYDREYVNPAAKMEYSNHTLTATLGIKF